MGAKNTLKHYEEGLHRVVCAWTEPPPYLYHDSSLFQKLEHVRQTTDEREALLANLWTCYRRVVLQKLSFYFGSKCVDGEESRLSTSASPKHCNALSYCDLFSKPMCY